MGRIGRWRSAVAAIVVVNCIVWPLACTQHHVEPPPSPATPVVRVRLLVGESAVTLRATTPPTVKTAAASNYDGARPREPCLRCG